MKVILLLALVAAALAAPSNDFKLDRALKELLHELESRTLLDKDDPTPIPNPKQRVSDLLEGEFADLAEQKVADGDPVRLADLLRQVVRIYFEAIAPEDKAAILSRFVEGYIDHVVYTEKNNMYNIAGGILDSKKRAIMNTIRFGMRYPGLMKRANEGEEGSGPYIFGIFDAVNYYVIDPADTLVGDVYEIAYPDGDNYLGGMFYDIEALTEQNAKTMSVRAIIGELSGILSSYEAEPERLLPDSVLDDLGARIMEYGRYMQAIDAKDTPPVRGVGEAGLEKWAEVFRSFKNSNKYLSHAIRRVAKYVQKDKMENLCNELGDYVIELLVPGATPLEDNTEV